jgi:uridine monophosphate synthetase
MTDILHDLADALFSSGCLKFGRFRIKSGASSPYYIDLACLLSSAHDFCAVTDIAVIHIGRLTAISKIDKLATIELKGALILPSIACKACLPCTIVRKEDKAYGATGRIAGADVIRGERVLFFDDVISEGTSKLEAIRPLEQLGARVENILVVVDRQQGGKEKLKKMGYKVHAMAKVSDLVDSLYQRSRISKEQLEAVLDYIGKT